MMRIYAPFQLRPDEGGLSSPGGLGFARSGPPGLGRRPGRERAPSSSSCKAFGRGSPAPTQAAKRPTRALPLGPAGAPLHERRRASLYNDLLRRPWGSACRFHSRPSPSAFSVPLRPGGAASRRRELTPILPPRWILTPTGSSLNAGLSGGTSCWFRPLGVPCRMAQTHGRGRIGPPAADPTRREGGGPDGEFKTCQAAAAGAVTRRTAEEGEKEGVISSGNRL